MKFSFYNLPDERFLLKSYFSFDNKKRAKMGKKKMGRKIILLQTHPPVTPKINGLEAIKWANTNHLKEKKSWGH